MWYPNWGGGHFGKCNSCEISRGLFLRKIRKDIDQNKSLFLYKSLILSYFDYLDAIYGCATKDALNQLQLIQNSASRMILFADMDTHTADMHRILNLLPLDERRFMHCTFLCHESIYFEDQSSISFFFVPIVNVTGRYTRHPLEEDIEVHIYGATYPPKLECQVNSQLSRSLFQSISRHCLKIIQHSLGGLLMLSIYRIWLVGYISVTITWIFWVLIL